jgi:LAT3 family solute carrier family 43 protein 2
LGSAANQLQTLGDNDGMYVRAVGYIIPFGFLLVPISGYIMDKYGLAVSMHLINVLGLVFGVLILVPNLKLQMMTYVVVAIFRIVLFSSGFAFYVETFGFQHFGRLAGVAGLVTALFSTLQFWLAFMTYNVFNGDHAFANWVCLLLSLPLSSFAWYVQQLHRTGQTEK